MPWRNSRIKYSSKCLGDSRRNHSAKCTSVILMIQKLFTDKFHCDTVIDGMRCVLVSSLKFSQIYFKASVKWQFMT
jgi:hypothetical protein